MDSGLESFMNYMLEGKGNGTSIRELLGTKDSKFFSKWCYLISREVFSLAKKNTKSWFNAKFSPKSNTPLIVRYNKDTESLYILGKAPNANVGKSDSKSVSRRVAWGKTDKQSTNPDYQWKGKHFHRVFIPDSHVDVSDNYIGARRVFDSRKGFWFTSKKKLKNNNDAWFTKGSHHGYKSVFSDGVKKYVREDYDASRWYSFPAEWKCYEDNRAEFVHAEKSVSDEIMNDPAFWDIVWNAFVKAEKATKKK